MPPELAFSEYIIYADESGSPVLSADHEDYPVFVLVFLIVRKDYYAATLVPQVQMLKFDIVGHDQLMLHERDIRRQSNQFAFLQVDPIMRASFMERVSTIMHGAEVDICCAIIDKTKLKGKYPSPWSPYDLALTFCMEKAASILWKKGERMTDVNVVFEARGANEDRQLELEFRRIASGSPRIGDRMLALSEYNWTAMFVDKRANSTGLQMADLAARPLGLGYLRPNQPNRARDILKGKMVPGHPKLFP
jgi:Protein of unknown function (DUF3800)